MSWKDRMDEWGGGEVSFLSEDGEAIMFIVVDEPVLLTGKFKGKVSERIGCPVVTSEGFTLLIIGKRLARRLARYEIHFVDRAFLVVRRGEHGDIETTYELSVIGDEGKTAELFELAKTEFQPELVQDAVSAAQDIVKG